MISIEPEIVATVCAILSDLCGLPPTAWEPNTRFATLPDWDSFRQVEVIVATEEAWGVAIDTRDMDRIETIADLAAAIQRAKQC
jgi:acyl carrier protein